MFLKMFCYAWPNVLQYLLCIANVLNKLNVIRIYNRTSTGPGPGPLVSGPHVDWTWTRTFGVRSGPDLGPGGPGPDFGQSSYAWPNVLQYLLCIANVLNKLNFIRIYNRIHSSIHYNIFRAN